VRRRWIITGSASAASGDHLWMRRNRVRGPQRCSSMMTSAGEPAERTLSVFQRLQFESNHPGKLNSTAVILRVRQDLAAAAYSSPRSSNAKSPCGAFSADSPKIEARVLSGGDQSKESKHAYKALLSSSSHFS
jgi:hypothetical protein